MFLRLITVIVLSCYMAGCVNLKPTEDTRKEYTLGLVDLPDFESEQQVERGYIARPHFPGYMEGYGLKVRSAAGEVFELKDARWAEPIEIGAARALSHYIEAASGGIKSGFYPWPQSDFEENVLHVRFHQLIATEDGRIQLSASWEIKSVEAEGMSGVLTISDGTWIPGKSETMVSGLNAALEALATEIWATVKKR